MQHFDFEEVVREIIAELPHWVQEAMNNVEILVLDKAEDHLDPDNGGLLGLYLHLRGNAEFERELHPAAAGWTLWWDALRGATPALAPGALAQLGLVGLAYAWPTLHRSHEEEQR